MQALASEDPVPGCFGGGNPESGERDGFSHGFSGNITRTEEIEKALVDMKFEARERKTDKTSALVGRCHTATRTTRKRVYRIADDSWPTQEDEESTLHKRLAV